jgi:hypothetical protein
MSIVDVYHVGAQEDILASLQHGSGLKWSTETEDWLGHGIYFWEDPSWAEWWYVERWVEHSDTRPGSILAAKIETELLLDLGNRNDSETFQEEAHLAMLSIQRRGRPPRNDPARLGFALDCAVANSVQVALQGSGKYGLRMPFFLGPSITKDGNFYANQHLQICLWNAEILQDARQLPSQPDRLSFADFV